MTTWTQTVEYIFLADVKMAGYAPAPILPKASALSYIWVRQKRLFSMKRIINLSSLSKDLFVTTNLRHYIMNRANPPTLEEVPQSHKNKT